MSTAVTDNDRYVVISTDSHAGGSHAMYREYLEKEYLDEFDAWRAKYSNPFRDLQDDGRTRNWDGELRLADQRADGVVAEVTFPNTVPPFFPTGALLTPPPNEGNYRRRLAGIRAHNRWMVDWVSQAPNERAGVAQIFLNDLDEAVKDVEFAAENGLKGGILLPAGARRRQADRAAVLARLRQALGRLPGQRRHREPALRWRLAELRRLPGRHVHVPRRDDLLLQAGHDPPGPERRVRALPRAQVRARRAGLRLGAAGAPAAWDTFHQEIRDTGRVGELGFPVEEVLPMAPSDYVKRNVWFAASFPGKGEVAAAREVLGTDRVMWAQRLPPPRGHLALHP